MNFARPPSELISTGPMDENWKAWKYEFLIFLQASGQIENSTDVKAYLLMNLMGPIASKVLEKLIFDSPHDREDFDILLKKFDDYFLPKVTETKARFIFFTSVRQQSESIKQYVNTLQKRATACQFGDLMESLIRDKIVLDVKSKTLRKHLLNEPDLSLALAIELWEMYEQTEKILNLCVSGFDKKLDISTTQTTTEEVCEKCGMQHELKKCPARGQICDNCGMLNHFGKVCIKPPVRKSVSNTGGVQNDVVNDSAKKVLKFFNPGPITKVPGCPKENIYD